MKILLTVLLSVLAGLAASVAQDSPYMEWTNLASGKSVTFITLPNEPAVSDEEDAAQLVDGLFSKPDPTMWHDKAAVGWIQVSKAEFIIDLAQVEPIRGVALRAGGGASGVTWPTALHVLVSEDGEKYIPVGDVMKLMAEKPGDTGYHELWLMTDDLKTHGRYVKFVVAPGDSGQGVYFFLDEVEIYRGEDSWLEMPLKAAAVGLAAPGLGQNVAAGAKVDFLTQPSDPDVADAEDEKQLVDGSITKADPLWLDREVIGWRGAKPAEFVLDLGAVYPINGVAVHLAAGSAGVEWPESLIVEVSENGIEYVPVGNLVELSKNRPPHEGYRALWLLADDLKANARYVKFQCTPRDLGNGAYLYMDEVEVYRDPASGN